MRLAPHGFDNNNVLAINQFIKIKQEYSDFFKSERLSPKNAIGFMPSTAHERNSK